MKRPLRALTACITSLLTAACAQTPPRTDTLPDCIATLRAELPRHPEVSPATFDRYTQNAQDLRPTIDQASQAQPEFVLPVWDYIARRADAERAADGAALMAREAEALKAIEQRHGVDAASVVAVFGIETDYGRVPDRYPVVDATLSRACLRLNSSERKRHFFAALQLLQQGLVQPEDFKGSWAGAFGLTQFMPGTFVRHADDGDGDGRPDILHSVPDALATTARYLKDLGWRSGQRWGVEVRVPASLAIQWNAQEDAHQCLAAAQPVAKCRGLRQWAAEGVTAIDGTPLPEAAQQRGIAADAGTALLMPAGPEGPAWLVTANYQALWGYNRADAYALAIGLLSDALRGEPPQRAKWPTDDPGLSRAELRELQRQLRRAGHCNVVADGLEGPRTRAAIRAEEAQHGLPESGRAGQRILGLLRESPAAQVPCDAPAQPAAAAPPAEPASGLPASESPSDAQEQTMKDQKQDKSDSQRQQAPQGGAKQGSQGGRTGGEASSGGQQQQQPKPSSDAGERTGAGSSQGLSGAQGSGGGADRGMQQSPLRRSESSRPDSLDRND